MIHQLFEVFYRGVGVTEKLLAKGFEAEFVTRFGLEGYAQVINLAMGSKAAAPNRFFRIFLKLN